MQYNISIPQREILDSNLDIDIIDAAIFDFIKDFAHSKFCQKMTDESGSWFWISYEKVIDELPILGIKTKDGIYRRFKKLSEAGLIEFGANNQIGGKTYFRFGANYELLYFGKKVGSKTDGSDEKSEGYGFSSVGGTDRKPYKQNHYIEQDTIQLKGNPKKNVDNSSEPLPVSFELKKVWLGANPAYPFDLESDMPELARIARFIESQIKITKKAIDPHFGTIVDPDEVVAIWGQLTEKIVSDKFWALKSLKSVANHITEFWNKANKNGQQDNADARLDKRLAELLGEK